MIMRWSFRYEGSPDDLEKALEVYRKKTPLLIDDITQFEAVETLIKLEMIRVPQKSKTVLVVARGDDIVSPELENERPVRRELFLSVVAK